MGTIGPALYTKTNERKVSFFDASSPVTSWVVRPTLGQFQAWQVWFWFGEGNSLCMYIRQDAEKKRATVETYGRVCSVVIVDVFGRERWKRWKYHNGDLKRRMRPLSSVTLAVQLTEGSRWNRVTSRKKYFTIGKLCHRNNNWLEKFTRQIHIVSYNLIL